MAKNVEMFMSDILVALIDEAPSIPQEVLEIVLAQFTQKASVTLDPSSYDDGVLTATSRNFRSPLTGWLLTSVLAHPKDYSGMSAK